MHYYYYINNASGVLTSSIVDADLPSWPAVNPENKEVILDISL